MKNTVSLDDLALFIEIAESGSLTVAAKRSGKSIATLSRRMTDLETHLDQRLFNRGTRGYTLTPDGGTLLADLDDLRQVQVNLRNRQREQGRRFVRITCGHWVATYLAETLHQYMTPDDIWRPAFLTTDARMDIARRQADIGIRNNRPDQNWLAGRRISTVEFAPFATSSHVRGWINRGDISPMVPSQRWIYENCETDIVATASDPRISADMALAGMGRVLLPVFAGRRIRGLVQTGPVIDELTHENWIVFHQDARHDQPIRAAIDQILKAMKDRDVPEKGAPD